MVFKNFYVRLGFRLFTLTAALFLLSYCLLAGMYLRSVYVAIFVILLAVELFYFIKKFTDNLTVFFESILHRDFTIHFNEKRGDAPVNTLYSTLNRITALFKKISIEKEIKHRYLERLVEHVTFGVISYDASGKVHLVNEAFFKICGISHIDTIEQIKTKNESLYGSITTLAPGQKETIKTYTDNHVATLILFSSDFKLDNELYRLTSVQNITNELSAAEIEAWQRLIKVLTHEIMNSVSPIMSLSDTLDTLVKKQRESYAAFPEWSILHSGLEAIKIRSQGLYAFTERYRELTRIPSPKFQQVNTQKFIRQTLHLLEGEIQRRSITLHVNNVETEVMMDSSLMEQVLINLMRNAMEALEGRDGATIKVTTSNKGGRFEIHVSDNGSGVEPDNLDKIFVPFFTTKRNGSGIGLALSRQIIVLHGGEIFVQSELNKGTTFTIIL